MANRMQIGVYVHIPFCKSRCKYCDFFSTTLLEQRELYVSALLREIEERKVSSYNVQTIYFGGGTPSLISPKQIACLLDAIGKQQVREVTVEVNPGDLSEIYLTQLKDAGVNRLSIGIQSFQNRLLELIGRRHTAQQALSAVSMAKEVGFENLSIDLIYALPTQTLALLEEDIRTALSLEVQHISTYGLTYEENTPLTLMVQQGEWSAVSEETENQMYDTLCQQLTSAGYEHYEVSNFAIPAYRSQHNSSYWNHTPYIGLGAGAHSFDGTHRRANSADLQAYLSAPSVSQVATIETLTEENLYNEQVMLSLRTSQGLPLSALKKALLPTVEKYIERGLLIKRDEHISVTQQGLHLLNRIIEDLMI